MHKRLLGYLCDPVDGSPLELELSGIPPDGDHIESGELISRSGHRYPIIHGIPRFASDKSLTQSVAAFGKEWNHFNYDHFRDHWKTHIADGVFGGTDYFAGKTIVDCAAGSGMHCRWMAEAGAQHVIALELSDSVDGVMRENLRGLDNVDVVQCSIDAPPIRAGSIVGGLVICNAAIQHTPSVEKTARALWRMVGPGGELAFNCYARFPNDPVWMARYWMIYRPLRAVLSRVSFETRLGYAKLMARLRMLPVLGSLLEKANILVRGDVPPGGRHAERLRAATVLNTFDWYGGHSYQHHLSANELAMICRSLSPAPSKVQNLETYQRRPVPPGMQIRLHQRCEPLKMIEKWVKAILADPLTKLPATPEQIGMTDGVIDARRYMPNTVGFSNWKSGQGFYEEWSERTVEDYRAEIEGVAPVYEYIRMGGRVLDVGGGAGTVRHFLPPSTEFVSIDPYLDHGRGIGPLKRKAYPCLNEHLNFIAACAEFLPFQAGSFDWAHMRSMLDHVQSPDLALIEAARVLKPGGRLVIGLWVDGGKSGKRTIKQSLKEIVRGALVACGFLRFRDHHTFHPTFANLQKIITDNGFEIEDVYWQSQWHDNVCYITAKVKGTSAEQQRSPAVSRFA